MRQPIKLLTFSLSLAITLFCLPCNAHNSDTFKNFYDYTDITPTKKSDPRICRVHLNAKQKINDRKEDPTYKLNDWKLVMRRGLFKAEVEMAMSEIFLYFIGYSTDLDVVEEKNDYFIARREFKHFDKWDDVVKKNGSDLFIKNYTLQDDGQLVNGYATKTFLGLADVVVLAEFFGDNDAKHYNYGIQENNTQLRLIDYDLEDAFYFKDEAPDIEKALVEQFGEKLINMTWYQEEKRMMQKKIAETPFPVIENIIRKNITVTRLESSIWLYEKILRDPAAYPDMDRSKVKKALEKMYSEKDTSQNVDNIVDELRIRHNKLLLKSILI